MVAAGKTQREARRVRQAQRDGARHRTLAGITGDQAYHEATCGTLGPRATAAVVEPAPLGRLHAQSHPRQHLGDDAPVRTPPVDAQLARSVDWQTLDDLDEDPRDRDELESTASLILGDVFRMFGPEYRQRFWRTMTTQQDRVLREVAACYTPLMGLHAWTCQDCGTVVELPNGCGNRPCPTCGEAKRLQWAEATAAHILPVPYYHVIQTVPQPITRLAMINPSVLYPIMMRTGAEAIKRCGRKLFQVELALLSLLHTWGSLMNAHLHTHDLLAAGGLWIKGMKWIDLSREQMEDLLLLVSTNFPRLFIKALRQAHAEGQLTFDQDSELAALEEPAGFERWLDSFNTERWVIRCPQVWEHRESLEDPDNVVKTVKYLANYANRLVLSNDRIEGIDGHDVLLRYKDYRDGGQWKTQPIDGVEFIGRFLQHLLPKGMQHIRRYGWMGSPADSPKRTWLRQHFRMNVDGSQDAEQEAERTAEELPDMDADRSRRCHYCQGQAGQGHGRMVLTDCVPRPSVMDLLGMPLEWFGEVRAGAHVILGEHATETEGTWTKTARERPSHLQRPCPKEDAETGWKQLSLPFSGYL